VSCRTSRVVKLSRPGWGTLAAVVLVAIVGAGAGGCSMSYQLGSLFGQDDDKPATKTEKPEVTGTLKVSPAAVQTSGGSPKITPADLAAASAAAANILASGTKSASAPWENPATGARGMVTPLASAYAQDGTTCRDFLASVVRDEDEAWLQGEACRGQQGKWVVRSLRPWKRA
jgi:surface antigen